MVNVNKLREIQVYRKTVMDKVRQVIENGGFTNRKSEILSKVLKFQNNDVPIVPQFLSKGSGKSVYNYEGIKGGGSCQSKASTVPPTVKRNIGINKKHIDEFNENIKSICVLDPNDPFVENKF
jgi:hypothetical protein